MNPLPGYYLELDECNRFAFFKFYQNEIPYHVLNLVKLEPVPVDSKFFFQPWETVRQNVEPMAVEQQQQPYSTNNDRLADVIQDLDLETFFRSNEKQNDDVQTLLTPSTSMCEAAPPAAVAEDASTTLIAHSDNLNAELDNAINSISGELNFASVKEHNPNLLAADLALSESYSSSSSSSYSKCRDEDKTCSSDPRNKTKAIGNKKLEELSKNHKSSNFLTSKSKTNDDDVLKESTLRRKYISRIKQNYPLFSGLYFKDATLKEIYKELNTVGTIDMDKYAKDKSREIAVEKITRFDSSIECENIPLRNLNSFLKLHNLKKARK